MKEIFDSFLTTLYLHLKKNLQYFENQTKDESIVQDFTIQGLYTVVL